jgi:tetratricopeptide (TPR) repeat protein
MKKILIALAGMIALVACGGSPSAELLRQAFDVVESRPDSALVILGKMDVASLTEEERAEYGLLMTMVDIKTRHEQIKNDSMIAASVRYYDQHGDKWHQAMAYHYRGVVKYALKNVPEAIKDLKKAETLAETLDDELLRNKIYERLAYCNYWSSNSPLLLKYSQKLLHSSMKMNDSVMVARSYLMVASGFDAMGMKDSATVNLLQSLDWVDALNDSLGRNDILDNVAMMYQEAGDVEKAEQYLTDWVLKHSSRGRAYATLACIRQKQGRYEEAVSCAKKSLEAEDYKVHKQSLELLAELYSQMGDSSRAYAMQRRSKEFADSLASANKASQMADWQMKFDEQQMKEASDRKSRWLLWGVVLAVAVVAVGWWWHCRKMRTFGSIIDANVRQIAAQKQEIARIEAAGTQNSRQIEELKRQVAERQEQLSARLHVGTKLYDRLRQGEGISQASGKDLQCLVEFYALLRPMQWYQWEQRYHALTPKQVAFLILQDELHSTDDQIARALGISESTVRVVRSRIKGREK